MMLLCVMCGMCGVMRAQTVSNVTATQVGKTIHVSYDLDKAAVITLHLSTDSGKSYQQLNQVSGDVGKIVGPGHKTIVWDVLAERERLVGDDIVFKVMAQEIMEFTVGDISFNMIFVQGGTFTMGCTSEQNHCEPDEMPTHFVSLNDFYMGETEVTQALWVVVMGNNPSHLIDDNLPVDNVSWNDCQEFIKKLNRLTGETFRLPTEAEWEFAARGGCKSKGYKYAGGNIIEDVAWYSGNSNDETHLVKTKAPNELGLYDMSGNVWEWCQDKYSSNYYSSTPFINPSGPSQGTERVLRGGSLRSVFGLSSSAESCRVADRDSESPDYQYFVCGFRLAMDNQSTEREGTKNNFYQKIGNLGENVKVEQNTIERDVNTEYKHFDKENGEFKVKTQGGDKLEFTVNGVTFTMIFVQGGTFTMGCTSEQGVCPDDEKPLHSVTISDFWICENEVTQLLWVAVMGSNPSEYKGDNRPVENVSWNDCQEFIRKLNTITGKSFRFPTEAEWEYAARGGSKSKGYIYAGSNYCNDVAWVWLKDESDEGTHDVKTKLPNELGLYDISGNVWEWCKDWYSENYYSKTPSNNPLGPSSGLDRVLRGGSWSDFEWYSQVSIRYNINPDVHYDNVGFRLSLIR